MRSQSIATRTSVTEPPRSGRASWPAFPLWLFAFSRAGTVPLILLALARQVAAQNVTIQQPVISNFEIGTTVSVPDSGGAFLGGVGTGARSRSTYGPFPMNTNTGSSIRRSSASVHARIHDFGDLDRQALGADERGKRRTRNSTPDIHAAHAWRTLHATPRPEANAAQSETEARQPASTAAKGMSRVADSPERGTLSTAELYDRGMKANASGKRAVALVFLRLARDRGSADAARELAALEAVGQSAGKRSDRPRELALPANGGVTSAQGGSR